MYLWLSTVDSIFAILYRWRSSAICHESGKAWGNGTSPFRPTIIIMGYALGFITGPKMQLLVTVTYDNTLTIGLYIKTQLNILKQKQVFFIVSV